MPRTGHQAAKTFRLDALRAENARNVEEVGDGWEPEARPSTRGECEGGVRPCPFASCSHHLYLDVNPVSGAVKLNFPHLEIWEMAETCSLDVADRGGITLEEVGAIVNLTRERVRQLERQGVMKARRDPRLRVLMPGEDE
jgi:hypothetical protein